MTGYIVGVIICGILFIIFGLYFLISLIITLKIIKPSSLNKRFYGKYNFINENVVDDGEEWTQLSDDNFILKARYYKSEEKSNKYVILVPSYFGDSKSVSYLKDVFLKRNYNCLAVDNRTTGKSKGKYITFGIEESKDLAKWYERITNSDKNALVGVMGEGMGGSTAMIFASDFEDIKFCLSYDPYINFDATLASILNKSKILAILIKGWISTLAHVNIEQINIEQWCIRMKCDMGIIATRNNDFISNKQYSLLDGCKNCDIIYVPNDKHLLSLRRNIKILEDNIEKYLN
jgi:alpha/beta superfamily hydrolase